MNSGIGKPWFVGCACDRKFVEHTAVMLTSLDINGDVPEATVLVAGFDLTEDDVATLRAGAGRLGPKLRLVPVTRAMLEEFTGIEFRSVYPVPVLGRLFLPDAIEVPDARLLTLDSDMIVNRSVRPLLELNMHDQYLGAIHDVPRIEDLNYFNTGLMLIDVAPFRDYDVSRRALKWLAEQKDHPTFPDQDALNNVVGDRWYRLDRQWNWFYTGPDRGDLPLKTAHYTQANVAHFAGGKPWNHYYHEGRPLYDRYRDELMERKARFTTAAEQVDTNFIATAYEVLLGREPESDLNVRRWLTSTADQVVTRLVRSNDFALEVLLPLKLGLPLRHDAGQSPPSRRQRLWAADRLPIGHETRTRIERTDSWQALLTLLIEDERFQVRTGLQPILWFADAMLQRLRPGLAGPTAPALHASNDGEDPRPLKPIAAE